jgi:DNA-binding NarL/FixJ family response regulator
MFLAEKTVKNYVTSVLAKLGMERRTQAAVFAATHEGGVKRDPRP